MASTSSATDIQEPTTSSPKAVPAAGIAGRLYRVAAYFGLFSIFGSMLVGFRFDPTASRTNYLFDVLLYAAFITPHLLLTRAWYKQRFWGNPNGTPAERRSYILVTVVTWLAVLAVYRPLPGSTVVLPGWLSLAGAVGFCFGLFLFFEGTRLANVDAMLGVPGNEVTFTHGAQAPLFVEGQYASVRHPMYRAALLAGACTLLMHPNAAQVLWLAMIGGTFIAFIPVEEAQLVAGRGDEYRRYQQQTPYRLFRGIW